MNIEKWLSNSKVQLVLVALIAIAFINTPQAVLQNDLDSAVRWTSDYLFKLGSENLLLYPHTNGPLFFLKFPAPFGNSILISVLFDLLTKIILGWYLVLLSKHFRPLNIWMPFVLFVAFCTFLSFDFIIISIVLASCLITLNTDKLYALIPGILILVISIFIKASISFPSLFIFGSTILVLTWRKDFSRALKISGVFLSLFIIITLIIYGLNMNGFIWIIGSFIKTLGYGSDQAIYFNNFLPYVLLTVLFIILPIFLIRNKQSKEFFLITPLAIFAIWKYCLGREDFTHYHAWYLLCIVLAGFIIIINGRRGALIGAFCYFISFGFFITNTKRGDSPKQMVYHTPRFDYLPRVLLRYDKIKEEFQNRSNGYLNGAIISDSILQIIGDKTVDVFPWGLAVLSKYNLNYKPRPNFHSTILGSTSDKKEFSYFASKEAPEFLLWHNSQPSLYSLNAHDQVYLPNAVHRAFISIATNYKFIRYENDYALWQKEKNETTYLADREEVKDITINEWFAAPEFDSTHSIFGRGNLALSISDKIRDFLYKGRFFKIVYKLKNGKNAAHFISLESLQNGFLLQPYFTNPSMQYEEVIEIFIEPLSPKFKNQNLQLNWSNAFSFEN